MPIAIPPHGLLERDQDLGRLEALLGDARSGRGALAMIEAQAGQGKTALLHAVRAMARESGMRVLRATGAELERDFPFGVVRQLFEPVLHAAGPEVRGRLLRGAAQLAAPVFEVADSTVGYAIADASHARLHGLFWLCANLAEVEPLLLVVDDAHWADAPSLRFVDVLARRLEDLPVALAVAARTAEPAAEQALLDGLVTGARTQLFRPAPLTPSAIRRLAEEALGGEPDAAFVDAAAERTGGNPLFVRELLRALGERGLSGRAQEAQYVRQAAPESVTRAVVARLRRLPFEALAVARGVAVLGDRATPARIQKLAGLSREQALEGTRILVGAALLAGGRLAFAHPIIGEAVTIGFAGEVATWRRRAARVLMDERVRDDEVAAHLLASDPEGEAWAVEVLAAAGRRALAEGAPDVARRLLARALEEPADQTDRPLLLLNFALAEARTGGADALGHLEEAMRCGDVVTAARAAQVRAHVLIVREFGRGAAEGLRSALDNADRLPPSLAADIEDQYLDTLNYVPELVPEYRRGLELGQNVARPPQLAHLAFNRAVEGAPRDQVDQLARRALADGTLIEGLAAEHFSGFYAIAALQAVEAADEAFAALRAAEAAALRTGSPVIRASLAWVWLDWERWFGDLRPAEARGRDALALLQATGANAGVLVTTVLLAMTLIARGELDEPEAWLGSLPVEEPNLGLVGLYSARARLHVERGRWQEALTELRRQEEAEAARGWVVAYHEHAGALKARALIGLGRTEEARDIAERNLALHQRRDVAGAEAIARHALALCVGGDQAISELRTAADLARRSPSRLIQAQVLGELGAALRRTGHRVESREPLQAARDLARRCGARALEERVHDELVVAGARPRRVALTGVDALTAAERRVADLAAQGMSNRQIAEALFVTTKTVEVHLGHAYAKLAVKGRSQLVSALEAA